MISVLQLRFFSFLGRKLRVRTVYLDFNATTPLEPEVLEIMHHYLSEEYGNSGSRTHLYGHTANKAVETARGEIAELLTCANDEIIFTSGATHWRRILFTMDHIFRVF